MGRLKAELMGAKEENAEPNGNYEFMGVIYNDNEDYDPGNYGDES